MLKKVLSLVLVLTTTISLFACGNSTISTTNASENAEATPTEETTIEDTSTSTNDRKTVVIWTSGEDYKNDTYLSSLKEKFTEINFDMQYVSSSTIAQKIQEEGLSTTCDIVLSEEYGYLDMISEYLKDLSDTVDFNMFLPAIVPKSKKWTPEVKNGGCIMINEKMLNDLGLDIPKSYDDLLKPEYKNLIAMPSPASSGTGYMFLRQLTNEWGEDKAFEYFTKLSDNILQFTTSGSGPVNLLIQGEIAIALGMTSQGVTENKNGLNATITFFDEGSPFSMYGNAIVNKDTVDDKLIEVFKYLSNELCKQNNEMYFPDQIFKDFAPVTEGFPQNIKYGNMQNDTRPEKERLLAKWTLS